MSAMITKALSLTALCLALPVAAEACKCGDLPIEKAFTTSASVFTAEVVTKEGRDFDPYDDQHEITDYEYGLKVSKTFKGTPADLVTALSSAHSESCGVNLEKGEEYVVWIDLPETDEEPKTDVPYLHACSRTKPVSTAVDDLLWLEEHAGQSRVPSQK